MKRISGVLLIGSIWILSLLQVRAAIGVEDVDKGVVHVSYKSTTGKTFRVMIQKDEEYYTYNLKTDGTQQTFPLQMGNGEYKVSVMENTTGSKYRWVEQKSVNLKLEDANQVYLNSIQEINWNEKMQAIQKAQTLPGITAIYQYITDYFRYDYEKLQTLSSTYLPVIDKTFQEKKGICYDFSALYAAMLRSQGIPTKMVKGYTSNSEGYHAWNEAYDKASGKWWIIDTSYDVQVLEGKKPVKMIKPSKDYQKVGEY